MITTKPRKHPKQVQPECSVWGALAFTLRASRIVGVAPVRFTSRGSESRVRVSLPVSIYSYLFILVLSAVSISGLIIDTGLDPERSVRTRSPTSKVILIFEITIVLFVCSVGVFSAPKRMNCLITCLNRINKIHMELGKDTYKTIGRTQTVLTVIVCITTAIMLNFVSELYYVIDENRSVLVAILYGGNTVQLIITFMMEMQFLWITLLIKSSIMAVNDALENLIRLADRKLPENAQKTVRRLTLSYSTIRNVLEQLNESNGLTLFLLLGSFLVHLMETSFFIAVLSLSKSNIVKLILPVINAMFHFCKMMLVIEPGHRTQQELAHTPLLVSQLMCRISSLRDPLAVDVDQFIQQMEIKEVTFAPMGMWPLTRPLIAEINSVITTYLFIFLQFQALENKVF